MFDLKLVAPLMVIKGSLQYAHLVTLNSAAERKFAPGAKIRAGPYIIKGLGGLWGDFFPLFFSLLEDFAKKSKPEAIFPFAFTSLWS